MSARPFPFPLPAEGVAAGHLPPEAAPSAPAAFPPASPLCESADFHMVDRRGAKLACRLCPPPCPDCRGRGWRIITDDGTRPACITCDGLGWVIGERPHG